MARKKAEATDYSKGPLIGVPSARNSRKRSASTDSDVSLGGTAAPVIREMLAYEKLFGPWQERSKHIINRYRDQREEGMVQNNRKFNILWSNVQILKPTLYARAPKSEIVRRFKDQDPIARTACEIAERATDIEIETTKLSDTIERCVLDRLLPGRGQIWITYNPQMAGEGLETAKTGDKILPEYVSYKDFGHNVVPTWEMVHIIWRWKYFTKEEAAARWKPEQVALLEFAEKRDGDKKDTEAVPTARVAEVWNKKTRKVCWVAKSVPDYLDEYDDPLKLENFWPCPRPLYATLTNDNLIPTPDFYLYQDQANEIDKLTGRINRLTDALKVVGTYDQDNKALSDLFDPRGVSDNTLVPVNMNDLTGKGGLVNSVQLVPLDVVINTLTACYASRQQAIQAIYEITGISDVIRGATDPNETAEAQRLKSQFGGTRIRDMQQAVASFVRDVVRIMCEIIVEMYDPENLWNMTSAQAFTDPQQFAQAVVLLKNDKSRGFRIDIETDSTIALDEQEGKRSAQEFVTTVSTFIQQAFPLVQQMPQAAPMVGETLLFLVRQNKAGRSLEGVIEKFVEQVVAGVNQPKGPSPEEMKAQAEMQKVQAQTQQIQMKGQIQMQEGQQRLQQDQVAHQQEMQQEQQRFSLEMQQDQAQADQTMAINAAKAEQAANLQRMKAANTRPS